MSDDRDDEDGAFAPANGNIEQIKKSARNVSDEKTKIIKDEQPEEEEPRQRRQTWSNLGLLALSQLLGGLTFSLLSPFYTKEATQKGISVTETGIVSTTYILVLEQTV